MRAVMNDITLTIWPLMQYVSPSCTFHVCPRQSFVHASCSLSQRRLLRSRRLSPGRPRRVKQSSSAEQVCRSHQRRQKRCRLGPPFTTCRDPSTSSSSIPTGADFRPSRSPLKCDRVCGRLSASTPLPAHAQGRRAFPTHKPMWETSPIQ